MHLRQSGTDDMEENAEILFGTKEVQIHENWTKESKTKMNEDSNKERQK